MNRAPIYATNATLLSQTSSKEKFDEIQQPAVIRPPIRNAYNSEYEYNEAVKVGISFAIENNLQYIHY